MDFQSEEILSMPDLLFSKLCEDYYGINRGVYNTIDCWFYEQGGSNIVNRRKMVLAFCQIFCLSKDKKVKFGSGGLSEKLNLFWTQYTQSFTHQAI